MSTASHLLRPRQQLEAGGWKLQGNTFRKGDSCYLPLYEAKMIHHFNHCFGDYAGVSADSKSTHLERASADRLADPNNLPLPRYWVPEREVAERLARKWDRNWLLGWRGICRTTDERTVIASVLPRVGVGHSCPLMLVNPKTGSPASLLACMCTHVCDFAARQKIGGINLTYEYIKQLPVAAPHTYEEAPQWAAGEMVGDWLLPRVLELTYTAWDLKPFAKDCGYDGPPFRWDEERRFQIRCELDAAFFHLYGITRVDVDYIMDTFPIVKSHDEKACGEYRTKRVILEIYDAMAESIRTGTPYRTRLAPPPADSTCRYAAEQARV